MGMGRREVERQRTFWLATADTPQGLRHVFYEKLNTILAEAGFDAGIEELCEPFYVETGRRGIPPGVFFRMLYVGDFEGIDSQRGRVKWRPPARPGVAVRGQLVAQALPGVRAV